MGLLDWGRARLGWGASGPDPALQDLRFTVLDTELTGLDDRRDDIVSIGALHMQGDRIELGHTFQALVNPKAVLDGRTVVIHGITPSQLEAMPTIGAVLADFMAYAAGTVLVGHCLALDLAFLNRDARRLKLAPLGNPALDTVSLYGWLRQRSADHPAFSLDLPGLSLFDLAAAFEIPVEAAHTAIGDAFVTAQLFQRLLPHLVQAGIDTTSGLRRVGDPSRQAANLTSPAGHAHF
jgi:DNA polymerase-3 subunit epsilon